MKKCNEAWDEEGLYALRQQGKADLDVYHLSKNKAIQSALDNKTTTEKSRK